MAFQWIRIDCRTFKFTDGIRHRWESAPRASAWVIDVGSGSWYARAGDQLWGPDTFDAAKRAAENMANAEPAESAAS
jgi:hypothetical protein